MKLLLDENLSRRIVPALSARFPGSSQVGLLGLERSTDEQLCDFAAENDFVLVSKDDDFAALVVAQHGRVIALLKGLPREQMSPQEFELLVWGVTHPRKPSQTPFRLKTSWLLGRGTATGGWL